MRVSYSFNLNFYLGYRGDGNARLPLPSRRGSKARNYGRDTIYVLTVLQLLAQPQHQRDPVNRMRQRGPDGQSRGFVWARSSRLGLSDQVLMYGLMLAPSGEVTQWIRNVRIANTGVWIKYPLTYMHLEGKVAPGRSARHHELSRISHISEAVNKHDGESHGAQGGLAEEGSSGHLPQPSGKEENDAGPIAVQASAIEHDDNIVNSNMLFELGSKSLNSPIIKPAVHDGRKIVRNGRRATTAGRLELSWTPCKGPISPSYRKHPTSVDGKARRRTSPTILAENWAHVICAAQTGGDDPIAGMRERKDMESGPTEEVASTERQDIKSLVTSVPEQDCTSNPETIIESQGWDVSRPPADITPNTLDISRSNAQASPSVTGPCPEVRIGTRLSEDTNMLKDFLDRVKAKKAARSADISEAIPPLSPSPSKSPRKVLAAVDRNLPSPKRSQEIANRPGTPPGKHILESSDLDELDDGAVEPASFRRSARVRLPAPSKLARGTPSLIPVRRPTGSEPVVLQKSEAQELAITTRNNTRRNKGRSKPVDLTLQALAEETMQLDLPVTNGREGAKQVVWDETLVYHLEGEAKQEEKKKKPKVRRLKGLGTANGTPAAKKEVGSAFPYPAGSLGNRRKGRAKA